MASPITTSQAALLHLSPRDQVAVALQSLPAGEISFHGRILHLPEPIPAGHKFAIEEIAAGTWLLKYGQPFAIARQAIPAGGHVHVHNVRAITLEDVRPTAIPQGEATPYGRSALAVSNASSPPLTFAGYRRPDGRAATRNYVAVIGTVNCSSTVVRQIVRAISPDLLAQYPNVDGVIPLVHTGGCAMEYGGFDHRQLARILAGYARHPNIGAYLLVGLGCETGQGSFLIEQEGLVQFRAATNSQVAAPQPPLLINIQEAGGLRKTTDRALAALRELLPEANRVSRVTIPAGELVVGLKCGGSDGYSGLTANPALGIASDLLIAQGGTTILAETPEIFGGEHLLAARAVSQEVSDRLLAKVAWWREYAAKFGTSLDGNPSFGNKQGGLTTIVEKSLGAITKGGSAPLVDVIDYAGKLTTRGLNFMDSPGYDPASVTGMIASGAHVVCFTTGRGSCFGSKPAPTLKISSTTGLFERLPEEMDFDAGAVITGQPLADVGRRLLEKILETASGTRTASERQGFGDDEFFPWTPGPVL